jgi:hypothetical protein
MSHKSNKINKFLLEEEAKLQESLDEAWKSPYGKFSPFSWMKKKADNAAAKIK